MIGCVFRLNSDISCGAQNPSWLHAMLAMPTLDTVLSFNWLEVREGLVQFHDFDLVVVHCRVSASRIFDHQMKLKIAAPEVSMRHVPNWRKDVPRPAVWRDSQLRDPRFV